MACSFRLVFDASQKGPAWWFVAFGLLFVVVGLVGLWRIVVRPRGQARSRPRRSLEVLFWVWFLVFSAGWTTAAAVGVFGRYSSTQSAIRAGTPVLEGTVQNFHAMPYTGHDEDHFTVQDVYFAYSDYVITTGFNKTSSHGGPVHAGVRVRIHFTGPRTGATIVKLEVWRCGVATAEA